MSLISSLIFRIKHQYRKLNDRITIPPYSEKQEIILSHKEKFRLNTLVETGTFLGDTIERCKNDFNKIISFELSNTLAEKAAKRFENYDYIKIVQGDSGKLLCHELVGINEPCLFWLDGHYSSEFLMGDEYIVTARGDKNTPIVEEIKAILSHSVKNHVILIDDARCFNGKDDYPSIAELRNIIFKFRSDLSVVVKRDIVRITPVV